MSDVITRLDEFYGIKELNKNNLDLFLSYENDGDYYLASQDEIKKMPSDVRFDATVNATYHALELLFKYYKKGNKEIYPFFEKCLNRCLDHGFIFEGFLSEIESINLIKHLLEIGIFDNLNDKQKDRLDKIVDSYRGYSENCPCAANLKKLLELYDTNIIFTYGTLMKGNSNHHYLLDEEYIGDAYMNDYGLLELGHFPGMVKKDGYQVLGELYKVSNEEKTNIDHLEGILYSYKKTFIKVNNNLYYAGYYEYNADDYGCNYSFRIPYGKWNNKPLYKDNYVWYVCYGSNLNYKRFMKYINRCSDTSEPIAKENIILPYNVYFAGYTSIWNGAKAFLNINGNGKSYCVKYLITNKQYEEIKTMEGPDYRTKVELGSEGFGIKQVSFTATHFNMEKSMPSKKYIDVIKDGLLENYNLNKKELENYINSITSIN